MQPIFGFERELCKEIFCKEVENDSGDFHFHSQIEICMVDEGETRVTINSEEKILKKGDLSIALSYDAHFYKPINYARTSLLIIPAHLCPEFTNHVENKKNIVPFISDPVLTQKIKTCFNELKKGGHNEISVFGYVYTVLGLLIDNLQFVSAEKTMGHTITSKLLRHIHNNFKNNISIKELAHMFGYNQSYISRSFKEQFGIGLKRYITLLRLKNAVTLLRQGKNISYCAYESGFDSLRTFYGTFKKEYNCTPYEFIKKVKEL